MVNSGADVDSQVHWVEVADDPEVGFQQPLNLVEERHAILFWEQQRLPVEKDVFVRGVLALRSKVRIEREFKHLAESRLKTGDERNAIIQLKIGQHEYSELETKVLHNAWMRNKKETLKNLSRLHRLLIVACAFAAMTQGWDQASMAGAATAVMRDLGKSTVIDSHSGATKRKTNVEIDVDHNTLLLGVTVAVPFFAGAILGLIMTDPVTRILHFGRRGAICVAGIFSFISVVGCASVHKWEHLLGFRILLGVGMAGKASIVPILLSETSPKNVRGILLVFWQLFVAFGLVTGSVANLIVYRLNIASSWRYMFIAAFIPALLLLSLILFSPESPRWLLKESGALDGHGNECIHRQKIIQKAYLALVDLRGETVPILAAGEIYLMHTRLIDEQHRLADELSNSPKLTRALNVQHRSEQRLVGSIQHIGWWPRVKLMFFRSGSTRRAHLAAAAVMISQQLCGINLLAFLAEVFLRNYFFHHNHHTTPDENMQLLGASLGFMIINFLATFIAIFHIDRSNGRRILLNLSFPCMAASLLGSALVLTKSDEPSKKVIVIHYIFLALFMIAYSIGEGPAAFVISAEVFPLVNRELGMSFAVCWNFLGAGFLAAFAPWLLKKMGLLGVLLLFSGTNLGAWFLCYWLVPDTGNEDLEDIIQQLEITPGFMFTYTLKVLLRKLTQPIEYCFHLGFKSWRTCGYGKILELPRTEFNKSRGIRAKPTRTDAGLDRATEYMG